MSTELVQNPLRQAQLERANGNLPASSGSLAATAGQQAEVARASEETMVAMQVAHMFPRNEVEALDRILNACSSPALAEVAVYNYSRGGTDIKGPSIRVAEAIAQNWGNMTYGIRELSQRAGASEVETFAWDLETNVRSTRRFMVPHTRYSRNAGNTLLTDPRDIYERVANDGARRLRACILEVIRRDVVEAAVDQCDKTLNSHADTSPKHQAEVMKCFERFGVTKSQIEAKIQRRLDAITPAQMVNLEKIYVSMRDALSGPEDWFDAEEQPKPQGDGPQGGSRTDQVKSRIGNRASSAISNDANEPPTERPSTAPVAQTTPPATKVDTPKTVAAPATKVEAPAVNPPAQQPAESAELIVARKENLRTLMSALSEDDFKRWGQAIKSKTGQVKLGNLSLSECDEFINEIQSELKAVRDAEEAAGASDEAQGGDVFASEVADGVKDADVSGAVAQESTPAPTSIASPNVCAGCNNDLTPFEIQWVKTKHMNPPLCKTCRSRKEEG